ncbi:MAG: hypothetical protein JRD93_10925 [Deltaproteobacteria bacterium]|nr:hypothetical protein [Deltaproteobacteria bacterium]MBW2662476.1 hypothetical protein [Deltaproteobacteria bacterium]
MKNSKLIKIAFTVCISFSLIFGSIILLNMRDVPEYTHMINSGKQMHELALEMKLQVKNYLFCNQKDSLDNIKDKISELRKTLCFYEQTAFAEKLEEFFKFSAWEEAINIYERLFDQLVLYHKAIDENIAELRDLEKNILAVIYSKMNPERGIIAIQEISIHEKGYMIYRNYSRRSDETTFEEKRKEAVAHFLIWAQKDKRIGELMDKDNHIFRNIVNNYKYQDDTINALKKENNEIINMSDKFFERGAQELNTIYHHCAFLSVMLLIIWLIIVIAIAVSLFYDKRDAGNFSREVE